MTISKMTKAELSAYLDDLRTELQGLATRGESLTGEDAERFDQAEKDFKEAKTRLDAIDARAAAVINGFGGKATEAGTPGPTDYHSAAPTVRDTAMRTLERATASGELSAASAERVEHLIAGRDGNYAARYAAAVGSEHYRSAFVKALKDPSQGALLWTPAEVEAYRTVVAISEERGLIEGTSGTGKYVLPLVLDPSVIVTNDGFSTSLRDVARVIQITGNSWNGVTSDGVVSEWLGEAVEAGDQTPTLGPIKIDTKKGSSWVPFSVELEEDSSIVAQLQGLIVDGANNHAEAAYVNGNGTTQPEGLITGLVNAGGAVIVNGVGAEALSSADPYNLQNALAPRWQAGAQFFGSLPILNTLRQFETGSGALKFPSLQNVPPYLLGRKANEISGMDGTINAAATEANRVLAYGDPSQFIIIERIGTTIELVPHVFGPNQRPTHQRGLLMHYRTGSKVAVPNAWRLLNVATTA